jgi:hypothetical protein
VALLLALAVATEAVRLLVTPPLAALAGLRADGQSWGLLPLAPLVTGGCAAALAACWAWLATCAVVMTLGALRGARTSRGCPRLVRTLVLTALGVAVVAGPAAADGGAARPPHHTGRLGVVGLPVPDRVATSAPLPVVRVRAGDSLWAIAERHLPAEAPDAAVEAGWRLLAAANADRVHRPDLIFPGTVLRVPPLSTH